MISFPTPETTLTVERMGEHFTKFHLGQGRVLHHFTRAEDVYFHDHPGPFRTTILAGGYEEEVAHICLDGTLAVSTIARLTGTTHEVPLGTVHRLTRLLGPDCWTLAEWGEKQQEPGFYRADAAGVWHRFWYQAENEWRLLVPTKQLV